MTLGNRRITPVTLYDEAGNYVDASAGGGGGSGSDRELIVSLYRVTTAFVGASVGDTVSATRIINVSGVSPSQDGDTLWYNEASSNALASAPNIANIELAGSPGLTDAQLRLTPLNVNLAAGVVTPSFTMSTTSGTIAAGFVTVTVANIGAADGELDGSPLYRGDIVEWPPIAGMTYDSVDFDATGTTFKIVKAV